MNFAAYVAVYLAFATFQGTQAWWQPKPLTTWQWQLTGTIDTSVKVQMYDVDLETTPQATIDKLISDGRFVICYFSAGSWENFRGDKNDFPPAALGKVMDGWPDEKWVDIRNNDLKKVMKARLDKAKAKKCHGVEPDNVDAYNNDSGFPLTYDDQITYNRWLATEAHARNLSIGLKNDIDQIEDLVKDFDWALNEQCYEYKECDEYDRFIKAGKAVFGVEYKKSLSPSTFCPKANAKKYSWLKKKLDLGAVRADCQDSTTWNNVRR